MVLKQESVHFVPFPTQGNKIEGVGLNRLCILGSFCPKQGKGFKPSAALLYPDIGGIPPPIPYPRPLSRRRNAIYYTVRKIMVFVYAIQLMPYCKLTFRMRPSSALGEKGEKWTIKECEFSSHHRSVQTAADHSFPHANGT